MNNLMTAHEYRGPQTDYWETEAKKAREELKAVTQERDWFKEAFETNANDLEKVTRERDEWKAIAQKWSADSDFSQQPTEFYKDYNEGTMRKMQAKLTAANQLIEQIRFALIDTEMTSGESCVASQRLIAEYQKGGADE